MADEIINDQAGEIKSPYDKASTAGTTYKLSQPFFGKKEITLFSGTIGADDITGTEGNDIIVTNGSDANSRDTINAGKGHDVVVLPGKDTDWKAILPKAEDYPPASDTAFWSETPANAYGRVVIMQNIHNNSQVVLRDVEEIVFADRKFKFESGATIPGVEQPLLTPAGVVQLQEAMKDGTVVAITSHDALDIAEAQASEEQRIAARSAADKK